MLSVGCIAQCGFFSSELANFGMLSEPVRPMDLNLLPSSNIKFLVFAQMVQMEMVVVVQW